MARRNPEAMSTTLTSMKAGRMMILLVGRTPTQEDGHCACAAVAIHLEDSVIPDRRRRACYILSTDVEET